MHANLAHRRGQPLVVREDRPAVAIATERLRRKEAGAADGGKVAALAPAIGRTEALRGVFDHRKPVSRRDRIDLVHVGGLPVQRTPA
jgi:hypothetical protein